MPSAGTADPAGFAGLVLAGGASRRMGRDKALLSVDGETLLERAQRLLLAAGADPVLVSGARPGGIPDCRPGLGPAGGLASVIQAQPQLIDRLVLVVPVDMPYLTASSLQRLAAVPEGACFRRRPLPLSLRVSPALADRLQARIGDEHGLSMRAVGEMAALREIPPPRAAAELENVNTPAEWRALLSLTGTIDRHIGEH